MVQSRCARLSANEEAGPLRPAKKRKGEIMGRKIAIVGAGAVGGYVGAHMAQAGEDVTFIDPWPEHVEHMRKHGLRVTHAMDVAVFSIPVRASEPNLRPRVARSEI
jgi:2-dehydropantoate 2-reductase